MQAKTNDDGDEDANCSTVEAWRVRAKAMHAQLTCYGAKVYKV